MSLRWKIALAMAAIVSVATVALGAASYQSARDRLLAEVDESLVEVQRAILDRRLGPDTQLPERGPLSELAAQIVGRDGEVRQTTFPEPIEVELDELALIGRAGASTFRTVDTSEGEYRVRSIGLQSRLVQVGRPLAETNRVLAALRNRTLLLVAFVALGAMLAGLWIANRVTASLRRLTTAAERVETTGSLDVRVHERGDDEVGRLSAAFDRMLDALARSREQQRRLVQDAGHELRTPLTSLRTNLDTLRRFPDLSADQRDAIVADLHAETEELTTLVDEVVTAASGESSDEPARSFDLAVVALELAARFERRFERRIDVRVEPSSVVGQRSGVARAISCLLDNACKFDTTGGPIEVVVRDGVVSVSDRGPGIPEGEHDRVFERFHRSDEARAMPGSGLGLSIVREVARRHGGDAFAVDRDGGGATVGFRLPSASG